ncbi:hypothetical protein EIP91_006430 [Steccherinum ochraceum]|uniref:DUF6533 domain-containing protein n=1 Tax=Steccherinum ochraceum TaxID=92696 RepID=A0A4R0RGG5_9APHY|nr:hypothetical protein EIP91_006430 [Steccherinum ochraceum]
MSYANEPANSASEIELEIIAANYTHIAVAAVFLYDTLLTLPKEIDQIWLSKFSGATILYFVNRYCLLAQKILIFMQLFPWGSINVRLAFTMATDSSFHSCTAISWTNEILLVATFLVIALFFSLRIYAIRDRNLSEAVAVLALGCVLPALGLYQQATISLTVVRVPILGFVLCDEKSTISFDIYSRLATAGRVTITVSDLLVLILTLIKTFKIRRLAAEHDLRTPLVTLLLRDGSLYFAAIFTFNLLDIVLLQVGAFGAVADVVTTFSVILIARFILNLRTVHRRGDDSISSRAEFSSIRFTDVLVGTLGASLVHGEDQPNVDEPLSCREKQPARSLQPAPQLEFIQGSSSGTPHALPV